ncbi:MAG TPA: putative quinol monooxygenase [Nitrospira sp.]|nr:putative quinol monooxygenase [Nitrospira sp.]
MANKQVTVVVRLKAKPGLEAKVWEELHKLLRPTRAEQGCLNFDMHQDPNDPGLFLFHENWTCEEDLQRHFKTPHIAQWIKKAEEMLAEPMQLTRWHKVE